MRHDVGLNSIEFLKAQGIPTASEIGAQGLSFRSYYQGVGHTTDDARELADFKVFLVNTVPGS